MCVSPQYLPDVATPVSCHVCWQCRENRVNDLIGRCIAESRTSVETVAITLTYEGDTPNSAVLIYPDFQKFIKRLRRAGHDVRYLVAGEYGSKKGRAHWHAVLFFKSNPPELPPRDTRAHWSFWTNRKEGRGFVFVQEPDYHGFRYVLKYVLKDQATKSLHLSMSKKPPLGYDYFMELADDYVEQGLSPQHCAYQFGEVHDSKGKHKNFQLRGRMRELFVQAFIIKFRTHKGRDYPFSEFLMEIEDKWYRDARAMTDAEWLEYLQHKPLKPREAEPENPKRAISYTCGPGADGYLLTRHADGTITLNYGEDNDEWHLADAKQLDAALAAIGTFPPAQRS